MKKIFTILLALPLLCTSIPLQTFAADKDTSGRSIEDEIIYSVFVDRFNNGRQAPSDQVDVDDPYTYNGGDIQGITDRLDQIKEAGFTAVAVSPIMENAEKGFHGYWTEDFYEVEEEFGDMEDVRELVKTAHDKDMQIILEMNLNYVAKTSPLTEDADKQDWWKENETEPIPATEWMKEVLVLDQSNEEVEDYLLDVAAYWQEESGADGFTLHAADKSNPAFLEKAAKQLKQKDPHFYLLATTLQGEHDIDALLDIEELDAVANPAMYEKMNEILSEPDQSIADIYKTWEANNHDNSLMYLDNINTPRFSNNFAEKGRVAETAWNIALGQLYFSPGVPIVYQGSEVPMYGPGYPENQYIVDFSSADPDLEKVFDKMAKVRDQFLALRYGDFEMIDADKGFAFFKREYDDEIVYVGINNDSESRVVEMDSLGDEWELKGLLHDDIIRQGDDGKYHIGLERETAEVFVIRSNKGLNWGFIGFVGGVMLVFVGGVIFLSRKQKKRERHNQKS